MKRLFVIPDFCTKFLSGTKEYQFNFSGGKTSLLKFFLLISQYYKRYEIAVSAIFVAFSKQNM